MFLVLGRAIRRCPVKAGAFLLAMFLVELWVLPHLLRAQPSTWRDAVSGNTAPTIFSSACLPGKCSHRGRVGCSTHRWAAQEACIQPPGTPWVSPTPYKYPISPNLSASNPAGGYAAGFENSRGAVSDVPHTRPTQNRQVAPLRLQGLG